jgi:hypothetical protein
MTDRVSDAQLARRLVIGLAGVWPTAREEAWLRHWQPAGVILFGRNVTGSDQLAALCGRLKTLVPGAEICADHEGGPVSQLAAAVGRPPAAWSLGVLDDADLTRRVHAETGRRLFHAGIDRVLAPCADVLSEPRNPVIGSRAFGSDPLLVSRQVAAAVTGLAQSGVRPCLKHWPGHGGSAQDSHLQTATTDALDQDQPFVQGLAAGADAVMVGHLQAPDGDLPASLDADRLARLRRDLGPPGAGSLLLYADDVTMGGLRQGMSRLGVTLADGAGQGMIEPADLPVAWFAALAGAGLDRILIRGIPTGAFPLPAGESPGPAEVAVPAPGFPPVAPEAYTEVCRRLARTLDADFAAPDLAVGWVDLTEGDRWEVAGGEGSGERGGFVQELAARFESVVAPAGEAAAPTGRALSRLLITSHRPLPPGFDPADRLGSGLAREGICLVLGHPSLGPEMEAQLGNGWVVSRWYEVDWGFWGLLS